MTPQEGFGVAVRTVGLLQILAGIGQLGVAMVAIGLGGPNSVGLLITGVPSMILGLLLLRSADWVVAFAYPWWTRKGD